ncbi:LacI family DNA-binding transcriptional regulator [Schaalia sp. ZJ1691]|uniref:LacI family DNA-binding transcriptional regulator n=1 Tax=Schaalia sp. ZJ1691 TaxID=2709404 RepID=UPI0013EAE0CD|nr:LacI family DNA-binding transcriptional regulator [Schaalia sp. ZJ1691]
MPLTDTPGAHTQGHRATLSDVATLAGVSVSTVSKALNDRSDIAESTKNRIREIADDIGFTPNSLAKSLLTGRTGTVGLITHDLEGRFSLPVLMGVEDAFGINRMSVLLCDARGDMIREQYHVELLRERRVDGLIVVGARPDPRPTLHTNPGVPVVYAYAPSTSPEDYSIIADHQASGELAVDHLVDIGRSRIAIISGDPTYGASTERTSAALNRLAEHGLSPLGGHPLYGTWSEKWGRTAMKRILDKNGDCDAVICGNDQIARGALDELKKANKRIPEDVSVIGHDNWRILAEGSDPQLTSIDMDLEQIGRIAAARLAEAMDGHKHAGIETLSPRLVLRGSTLA